MCRKTPGFWSALDHWWKAGKLKGFHSHLSSTPQTFAHRESTHCWFSSTYGEFTFCSLGGISQCLFVYNTSTLDLKQWTGGSAVVIRSEFMSCFSWISVGRHWVTLNYIVNNKKKKFHDWCLKILFILKPRWTWYLEYYDTQGIKTLLPEL